jgi:hypothetical protein
MHSLHCMRGVWLCRGVAAGHDPMRCLRSCACLALQVLDRSGLSGTCGLPAYTPTHTHTLITRALITLTAFVHCAQVWWGHWQGDADHTSSARAADDAHNSRVRKAESVQQEAARDCVGSCANRARDCGRCGLESDGVSQHCRREGARSHTHPCPHAHKRTATAGQGSFETAHCWPRLV